MTTQPVSPGEPEFKLTRGAVFPLVGDRTTWRQEHLLPIVISVCVALGLAVLLNPALTGQDEITQAHIVYVVLGLYIAFMVNYYVNQLCDRPKRLWLMAVAALITVLLMISPLWPRWYDLFYNVLPGAQWEKSSNAVTELAGYWFGTGLCEEGFKSLVLFALVGVGAGFGFLSRHAQGRPQRILAGIKKWIGLCEPLDGIVLGVASGTGFFLMETLGEYVPKIMTAAKYAGSQAYDGLVMLLARGIPELVGHSAWAGLFGYFIGLSVLRPKMAFVLVPLGWFSAAALHGAWDATPDIFASPFVDLGLWLLLGALSYALLAGAIFKAREISRSRAANFAKGLWPDGTIPPPLPAPLAVMGAEAKDWD